MKRKDFLKDFIIMIIFIGSIFISQSIFAVESTPNIEPLDGAKEFGSSAEIYKELSPELSPEEYKERMLQLKTYILRMQAGEVVSSSFKDFKATLQWMAYIRRRVMELEKFRADQFMKPVNSAAPSKSRGKDGSTSYSGQHAKVLKYIIENYSQLAKTDIDNINSKIQNTEGKAYKKGFSVTLNAVDTDEFGNTSVTPFSVTLKGANHFPDWSYAKQINPVGGVDKETEEWQRSFNTIYSYQKYLGWEGEWYAIGSKKKNAFGYSTGSISEIYNATENTITTTTTDIIEMDFNIREIKSLHRKVEVVDATTGIVGTSYKEDREVLEYHTRINDDGDIEYLPSLVTGVRYNNGSDMGATATEFKSYTSYDAEGREEYVLYAETQKDSDGSILGNRIYAYNVTEYDPITHLSPYKYGSEIQVSEIAGDFSTVSDYTDIAWRILKDEDAYNRITEAAIDPEEALMAAALSVAKMVIDEGCDYEAAKINAISNLLAESADPLIIAQNI